MKLLENSFIKRFIWIEFDMQVPQLKKIKSFSFKDNVKKYIRKNKIGVREFCVLMMF